MAELGYKAVTWMGGTNRWQKTDFSELPANVMFWPDNDEPGRKCMEAIATKYEMNPAWIPAPENAPKGWDAADGIRRINSASTKTKTQTGTKLYGSRILKTGHAVNITFSTFTTKIK